MVTKRTVKRGKTAGKKGGSKGDGMVEFTPDRSLPLILDGRTIDVEAGVKTKIPAPYKAVYDAAH